MPLIHMLHHTSLQPSKKMKLFLWKLKKCLTLFMMGNRPVCDWNFEFADNLIVHVVLRKHFLTIFLVTEVSSSELLKNLE